MHESIKAAATFIYQYGLTNDLHNAGTLMGKSLAYTVTTLYNLSPAQLEEALKAAEYMESQDSPEELAFNMAHPNMNN